MQENNLVNMISHVLVEKLKAKPGCIEYLKWVLDQPEEEFTLYNTTSFSLFNHFKLTKENGRLQFYIKNNKDMHNFSEYMMSLKVLSTNTGLALDIKSSINITSEENQTDLQASLTELPFITKAFDTIFAEFGF